jgi:hypothetical protein
MGKPANHVVTTASCDQCHSGFTTFANGVFNHTGITPGTCQTCHNGTTALGKPANHVPTAQWPSCDACHKSTTSFTGAMLHSSVVVTPGTCATCHERANPYGLTGRPSDHTGSRGAPNSCDNSGCHSTRTFSK